MSLSEQDRELLADAVVHANEASCWSCDEAPFATVEAIVARHVRAALTEAAERLTNAHGDLFRLAQGAVTADNERRLFGKCEGVRLAKSYLDEAIRNLSPDT